MADQAVRIGFIGFGAVASVFAAAMREHGAEIAAYDLDEGKVTVRALPLDRLAAESEWILSTVTPQAAVAAARACAPYLRPHHVYVDLNSTAPAVKLAVAEIIRGAPAGFAEGAILGAVGAEGARARILLGGPDARRAAALLSGLGLHAEFFSEQIGQASLFKMLRSIFSKGVEALLVEMLAAARRAGLEQPLWGEVTELLERQPFRRVAENWIRTHPGASERRYHELRQVNETLRELGWAPLMSLAAEAFFDRSRVLRPGAPVESAGWEAVIAHFEQRLRS